MTANKKIDSTGKRIEEAEKNEELREKILTLGPCIGPYDSPHRCSNLHCEHCGICDISEDLNALITSQVLEANEKLRDDIIRRLRLLEKDPAFKEYTTGIIYSIDQVRQATLKTKEAKADE